MARKGICAIRIGIHRPRTSFLPIVNPAFDDQYSTIPASVPYITVHSITKFRSFMQISSICNPSPLLVSAQTALGTHKPFGAILSTRL